MSGLFHDIRHGFRMMLKSPGFTIIVVVILAVGIGANTALFDALDQVCMRPLPVREPHELVSVQFRYRHGSWEDTLAGSSYSTYKAYRDRSDVFTALMGFKEQTFRLRVDDIVESIDGETVTTNYFSTLGLRPALGRLIAPEKGQVPTAYRPVAVISHRLWRQRFEGRTDVIGQQIVLDDKALMVIGVTPAGFTGSIVGRPADVYVALGTVAQMQGRQIYDLGEICQLGRLQPEVDRKQAQAALQLLDAQMNTPKPGEPEIRALLFDGSRGYVPRDAQLASYPLVLFLGMAALVLVIACANVANLQLARALTRQREVAIRQTLGAGRGRIVRQLLVETLLLVVAGGSCGVLVALGLDQIICTFLPRLVCPNMLPVVQIHITPGLHPRVLLFVTAVSLATGVAFGLAPALQMVRRDVVPVLKESTGCMDLPSRRWKLHSLPVIGQIAMAVVVTVCSGLCLRNLIGLKRTDPGFDPAHILVVRIDKEGWLSDRPELRRFMENLRERVIQWPQATSAGLTLCAPLSESGGMTQMTHVEGFDMSPDREIDLNFGVVSPGYFRTLSQTLMAGRDFTVHDDRNGPKVMVVDEVFARRYWPNQNPIGKHVTLAAKTGQANPVAEVVGVVSAVKVRSIIEESRPWAYFPLGQRPEITPQLLIHTDGDPTALVPVIRREAARIQPTSACEIGTVAERIWGLLLPQRVLTGILNSFALVGLFLSATGIYAVMAYAVRQRTREIGIRMALGASRQNVLTKALCRGIVLLVLGLGLGLALSVGVTQLLTALVPQVRQWDKFFLQGIYTWDPPTYIGATLVIVIVTLTACYFPARRAAKIDPMEALRYE